MRKTYQSKPRKSSRFEVVGGRELALRLPLPLVEVWEEMQARVEQLAGETGLRKRVLAEKTLEVDSFKGALQKVEARRQKCRNADRLSGGVHPKRM